MTKAFVFGKFLPFHKGHEAMINFALNKCDFLTILVCCSDKELIPDIVRKSWIQNAFKNQRNIEVKTFNYLESELPNTSKTSREVSEIWASILKKQLPDSSIVITSEEYGNFVASFMNIRHIPFDISKTLFPISATAIREDRFANWNFLPDSVKFDFAIKVVIVGTESTGKTTLTKKLSRHFNCIHVSEAGREIIANSKNFSFADLHLVATEHAKRIEKSVLGYSPLIIIDTDIHTTKSYSRFSFNQELEVNEGIYKANMASLYLYLNNDVKYVQDGTRLNQRERNFLDLSHRKVLADHNIEIVEIRGNWDQRFEEAVKEITRVVEKIRQKPF